jgi:choice-of-anchor A domain-containing protein
MNTRPILLTAVLAMSLPALATGGGLETCPTDTTTYEMSNGDKSEVRVIWAPKLMGCNGTTLMAMLPATSSRTNKLWHNDALTDGGFEGQAKVVTTGCEGSTNSTHMALHATYLNSVWDVSFDLVEKNNVTGGGLVATVAKSPRGDSDEWKLMLVDNGEMRLGKERVWFTNMPANLQYGNQIGTGANPVDYASEFGGAFWMLWSRGRVSVDSDTGHETRTVSATGSGDFNYDLTVSCEPGSECPVDDDAPLGPASDYNVYVVGDMNVWNSDIAGWSAVGGDATVENYGLNTGGSTGTALSVAGTFTATDAQLYGTGGGEAGACALTRFGTPNSSMDCTGADFDAASADNTDSLDAIIDWTAGLDTGTNTATLNEWWPQLIIDGTDSTGVNAVSVDTCAVEAAIEAKWSWATDIQGWDIKGTSGSTLVINLYGDCGDMFFKNGWMGVSGVSRSNVVWVLHDMTEVEIKNVSVQGALFAPYTDVTFNNGNIDGTLVAASFDGSGESHEVSFEGDICPVSTEGSGR